MSYESSQATTDPFLATTAPPPKKRRTWLWVVVIVMSLGFVSLLICCGVGAYMLQNYGNVIFEPQRQQMNRMADLQSEVGAIESLSINFAATVEEGSRNKDFMILDGVSEKGDFQVSLKMTNTGEIEKLFLVLPDGSRQAIDLDKEIGASTVLPATSDNGTSPLNNEVPADEVSPLDSTEQEIRRLESELELN